MERLRGQNETNKKKKGGEVKIKLTGKFLTEWDPLIG